MTRNMSSDIKPKPDYDKEYQSFQDDVIDIDSNRENSDEMYPEMVPIITTEQKQTASMLFDFRRGPDQWPKNCELIDQSRFDELLEKATSEAEMAAKLKRDKIDEDSKIASGEIMRGGTSDTNTAQRTEQLHDEKRDSLHPEAQFETLRDGSTALILQSGYRLKLWLNDIFDGGDANSEARIEKAAKEKELLQKYGSNSGSDAWAPATGSSNYSKKWNTKKYLNEYTVTMDIKLLEDPPRDGIALFQTALIHSEENQRTKKIEISRSDGECIINQAGGVGILGTFGDTTKARVKTGLWKRVVISVCNSSNPKEKGVMKTWVGTEAGIELKEDVFSCNDRFAIDPTSFYPFSSAQASMMPGKIAIRAIRIDSKDSSHDDVKKNHSRDKFVSFFNEERQNEVVQQRKGFSLASLFAKPRPMWVAPSFVAVFGDAFIQNTPLEESLLCWSYEVVNLSFQRMLEHSFVQNNLFELPQSTRIAMSDTLHIMQQSKSLFRSMSKLVKTPTNSQLLSFLREIKKAVQSIRLGETLLFPVIIEARQLILILEKYNDRFFKMVVVQTNREQGLSFHSPSLDGYQIKYRTAMVLNGIPKKNCLDDVFWLAVYNMTIHQHTGDMNRFYEIVLPFLTGHPLESALIDAERAALEEPDNPSNFGELRLPQHSSPHVRCILEAFLYLLRRRKVSSKQVDQIHLCFASELVHMMQNDLKHELPNQNGVYICELALKGLSRLAVKVYDAMRLDRYDSSEQNGDSNNASAVLNYIYGQVGEAIDAISSCKADDSDLPPVLNLSGPANVDDPSDAAYIQFRNMLAWDVPFNDKDPGQQTMIPKYLPIDFLQIPKKVLTRIDAIEAIRTCDRLCTLIENQNQCIKNDKFLICSLIEHVFTQVLAVYYV